ncbi:MAG: prolipoprotein diacylglyceryl transferase [Candidatus Limiplasma sp.]|nr:prolipoprotein diacylglyceryl transferase [Candidatus Limiplasma sp.]
MSVAYSRTLFGIIPWYSFLIVLGILLAYLIGCYEEKRVGLPKDAMTDATLVAVPCGILGARLYFVAMEWERFAADPLRILYVWEGGVAIYGAVLGGALGVFLYCRKKKLSFWKLADIIAPGLLLAQAVGRWGNYFNMEAYGPALTDPALQFFPLGVQIPQGSGYVWHAATFFYESLWNLLGFGALWLLRKRQKRDGYVFFWYLLIYGSGRFIIEQLRTDSLWLLELRVSQWLSLVMVLLAAATLLWQAGKGKGRAYLPAALLLAASLARWFLAGQGGYGALLLLITGLWAWCVAWQRPPRAKLSFSAFWFLIPLALDVVAFLLLRLGFSPYGKQVQLLVASVTLPCYCLWLEGWLAGTAKRA